MELLLTHAGQVFDRERIYESVWGLEASGDNSVVKEHIRKIRRELPGSCRTRLYRNSLGGGLSMEAIKFRGLWSSFVLYVITTLVFVTVLSGLTIWGCVALQTTLYRVRNLVYLTIQRSDADGNETTITVPMPLNDMLKEIPSMISMEGTEGDLLSGEQNVKYSVAKIENSFTVLSPKRQLLYKASQIGMVAFPVLFFTYRNSSVRSFVLSKKVENAYFAAILGYRTNCRS